jgi:hypothetical protein
MVGFLIILHSRPRPLPGGAFCVPRFFLWLGVDRCRPGLCIMGDMNPTDYADPDLIPTEEDVEALRLKAFEASAANAKAVAAYRQAKEARRRGFDTARVLAEAEAKERAAASTYRDAVSTTEIARIAHAKATA